ncbi:MAG: PAS domain-containing protein, partial [Microcystaceae cyanobacterium]
DMKGEYTILLVDDSESDRGIYRRYLLANEGFDCQIIEAESLEEGLELWRSQSPDLVLTDINLLDGSGLELLAAIKNTHPSSKIPIIMMTGQGNERLAVQAMKLGASDYLVKEDITASTLCHYVETAIAQWNLSGKLTELQQLNQELEIRVGERTHALEASQSFNRSILEAIPDLLLRLNRDGTCLSYIPPKVNKDSFEPINQHISELLPPDLVERQLQAIEQALITRELQVYEHQVIKHNQITYEEIRILAINDQTVLAVVRDISDRKQAEQENFRIRERFQFLLASSPTIIYSCKPYGDYGATFMSENIKAILGYTPEEFVTQENFWANHIHPEDAPRIFAELRALFDQGTHSHEYRFLHQDGHYLWIMDQLQLVKDDQGNPIEIVGSFSDIS